MKIPWFRFNFFAFISGRPTIFNKPISPLNLKIGIWTLNRYADDRLNYSIGVWWCQLSTIALNFRYIYWHSILFCFFFFLSCASVTLKSMVFTPLSFMKYRVWDGLLVGIKGNVFVPFTQTCLLMEILVEPNLCWAIIWSKLWKWKTIGVLYVAFYCRIATSESLYQEVNLWLGAGGDVSSGSFFCWSFLDLETPGNSVLGQHGEISYIRNLGCYMQCTVLCCLYQ